MTDSASGAVGTAGSITAGELTLEPVIDDTGTALSTTRSERVERDLMGEVRLPAGVLYGVHTARAVENFPLARRPVHPQLMPAYGAVKLACALANKRLGAWKSGPEKAAAIERACREMSERQSAGGSVDLPSDRTPTYKLARIIDTNASAKR